MAGSPHLLPDRLPQSRRCPLPVGMDVSDVCAGSAADYAGARLGPRIIAMAGRKATLAVAFRPAIAIILGSGPASAILHDMLYSNAPQSDKNSFIS